MAAMINIDACTDVQKQLTFLTFVAGLFLADLAVRYGGGLLGAALNPQRAKAVRIATSVVDLATALGDVGQQLAANAEGAAPAAAQLVQQLVRQLDDAGAGAPPAEKAGAAAPENVDGEAPLARFMRQAART